MIQKIISCLWFWGGQTTKNIVFVLGVLASDLLADLWFEYRKERNRKEWKELRDNFDEKCNSRDLRFRGECELESLIEDLWFVSKENGWS